jgi:hypothetical protein
MKCKVTACWWAHSSSAQHELRGSIPLAKEAIKDPNDPSSRQRGVDLQGECLAGKDVDDTEHAQFAPGGQGILEEIERPLLVGPLGRRGATTPHGRQGFAATLAHRQAFLPVEPLHPLVVDDDPLPA